MDFRFCALYGKHMNSSNWCLLSALKNQDQLRIGGRNDKKYFNNFAVVEKYLFVKIHLFVISEETCWKLLGFPKAFLDGLLQSLRLLAGTAVQAVIPGYICIIDNLGSRHISAFLCDPLAPESQFRRLSLVVLLLWDFQFLLESTHFQADSCSLQIPTECGYTGPRAQTGSTDPAEISDCSYFTYQWNTDSCGWDLLAAHNTE